MNPPPKRNMKNNKGHYSQIAKNQWKENILKNSQRRENNI